MKFIVIKTSIVTLLALTVCTSAMAEWKEISTDDEVTVLVNPSSIRKNGNKVKLWSMFDYEKPQDLSGDAYLSAKYQDEFDCKEEQSRSLYISIHSKNMGAGRVVFTNAVTSEWRPVPPDTVQEILMKYACRKRK